MDGGFRLALLLLVLPLCTPLVIRVNGTQLVDGAGAPVVLRGVNEDSGAENCGKYSRVFDSEDSTLLSGLLSWRVNAVRLTLNENCWLGINGMSVPAAVYKRAFAGRVNTLTAAGIVVMLDLQLAAPGSLPVLGSGTKGLAKMPDQDHAPDFWRDVASTFKNNSGVMFYLFNEPYALDNDAGWACWRDGGQACDGQFPFQVAGMQSLVNVIRAEAGANNVIVIDGVEVANSLTRFAEYLPQDPLKQIVASMHMYKGQVNANPAYWDAVVSGLAQKLPVIAGEFGQQDCGTDFSVEFMAWMDSHGLSYLAWTWNVWPCSIPALIADLSGTPLNGTGSALYHRLTNL
eukprot:TRINITY_DN60477_c0_g1_i2.p1 TRINITY_DN60477_c0_g1~~TRINITY_DN60477_c0_g1_i2.p1  ORF type:complete len:345 (+),score=59.38 TRINITY_DN60477_c0_g1_i2:141-1175(+)